MFVNHQKYALEQLRHAKNVMEQLMAVEVKLPKKKLNILIEKNLVLNEVSNLQKYAKKESKLA